MPSSLTKRRAAVLFVAERFDRIERRRAVGRIESKPDPDGRTDEQSGDGPAIGKNQLSLKPVREQIAHDDPEHDTENAARFGNKHGFSQKLPENVAPPRADRFAHADLFRALG